MIDDRPPRTLTAVNERRRHACAPSSRRSGGLARGQRQRLVLEIFVETVHAVLAAAPRLLEAAERRGRIPRAAVDVDLARAQPACDAQRTLVARCPPASGKRSFQRPPHAPTTPATRACTPFRRCNTGATPARRRMRGVACIVLCF
ncbi:conserved hypothetical protein [Burkholderia multivorans CGD2M]|uniref:Uncharacterized protein n=1 Tax=Burkholderia multivorans CGD2 TaxID=513052 RepID=B9BM35_9BURK|nr:conserved hypothetical protein [Burkholderia multivorans CGD2]EEE14367.1 conserved hypothetical protein [Burkholderia multivorans CGD2M]